MRHQKKCMIAFVTGASSGFGAAIARRGSFKAGLKSLLQLDASIG
jgi:NADP-dependent 3-hydroxy acid dehydrogenase YdfG